MSTTMREPVYAGSSPLAGVLAARLADLICGDDGEDGNIIQARITYEDRVNDEVVTVAVGIE